MCLTQSGCFTLVNLLSRTESSVVSEVAGPVRVASDGTLRVVVVQSRVTKGHRKELKTLDVKVAPRAVAALSTANPSTPGATAWRDLHLTLDGATPDGVTVEELAGEPRDTWFATFLSQGGFHHQQEIYYPHLNPPCNLRIHGGQESFGHTPLSNARAMVLLPVTVAADVVTLPLQVLVFYLVAH